MDSEGEFNSLMVPYQHGVCDCKVRSREYKQSEFK
jgi:hypothetical protein